MALALRQPSSALSQDCCSPYRCGPEQPPCLTAGSGRARLEAAAELGLVQVATDQHEPGHPGIAVLSGADMVAISDHVHGLEGEAVIVALEVQDALGPQQVLPALS